jgi:hypothetical protein
MWAVILTCPAIVAAARATAESAQTGNPWTPIIVDTAGDGFELTSASDGVWFDLKGDGTPQRIAWTLPDSDDGWLAMDRNGNGRIDNGTELFGNRTPAYADRADPPAANGFIALSFLENPAYGRSVADQVIDVRDAPYRRLVIWIDRNHDGFSESEELRPVGELGLTALETAYEESHQRDRHGNEYHRRALSWWTNQGRLASPRFVYDVWLTRNQE